MRRKGYTVGEVARLARITVRTLHHYDEIGLLVPSQRSESGYRLYTAEDLTRLHQILLFRALGFSLESIRGLLDDPRADRRRALQEQRQALLDRIEQTRSLIAAVDDALRALDGGVEMDAEKLFEGFDPSQYEEEAKQRWGHTEAWRISKERTGKYRKEDWARIQAEAGEIYRRLAELLAEGKRPNDAEAMDAAEQHRLHIDRWFYPCPPAMHAGLGQMYVADPRFTEFFEKQREGLAAFVSEAFQANAARHGASVPDCE